jgi:hypothetical protein
MNNMGLSAMNIFNINEKKRFKFEKMTIYFLRKFSMTNLGYIIAFKFHIPIL